MNFYYGLVDRETNAWGFVEETDPRVHADMIYVPADYWRQLLSEQSQGRAIVCWEGRVFTAEPGRYYVDSEGWHKKSDEEFNREKAQAKREELVNTLYQIKADKAYGGVIINDALVFETNQTAVTNTVASLALMSDDEQAQWKFYNLAGEPVIQPVFKGQLAQIAKFGQAMINACFAKEGTFNEELKEATIEQLIDETWVEDFKNRAQTAMDEVENHIYVNFEGDK